MFFKKEKAQDEIRQEYRQKAVRFFTTELQNMSGSGALSWFRGALELAESLGVLTAEESNFYDGKAKQKYDAIQAQAKAEREALAALRKAERAAKAKAEKEQVNNG